MTTSHSRRARLTLDALETRAVPANNLTIAAPGFDDSALIDVKKTGATVTIKTKLPDAQLSLDTLQDALTDPDVTTVIVTTDVANGPGTTNGNQAANITWNAAVGNLDFTGFGTGKTLTFRTVDEGAAVGNITLTGVAFDNFGSDDRISLAFDSSDPGGDVTFEAGGLGPTVFFTPEAVADLTVAAGTGAFAYNAGGPALNSPEVNGAVTVTAGPVSLGIFGSVAAGGPISVTAGGPLLLAPGAGLGFTAGGDLTLSTTAAVIGDNLGLSAGGRVSVTAGTTLSLNNPFIDAGNGLSLVGPTGIDIDFGTYEVVGDVSIAGGTIDLTGVAIPNNVSGVGTSTVTATGTLTLTDSFIVADDAHTVSAAALTLSNAYFGGDSLSITGPITLTGSNVQFLSNTTIAIPGPINGAADLFLGAGGAITLGSPVGATTPLTSFNLNQGRLALGSNNLNAGTVTVGEFLGSAPAVLGMSGTIAGNLVVHEKGTIAPGGVGSVGTMVVTGNVSLNGTLAVDFGAGGEFDQLAAPAGVNLGANSRLGGPLGTGRLSSPTATLIDTSGGISGQFLNAPVGTPVIAGTDAITVAAYTPDLVVVPYTPPGGATAVATGFDPTDGTGFKVTLTGGGTVFTARDWTDRLFLVARDTTPLSKLTITTTANASDDVMEVPVGVLVSGSLATFTAPKVNIGEQFRASGWVGSATVRDLFLTSQDRELTFGGLPTQVTKIQARNLTGDVTTGSTLTLLKVTQSLGGGVNLPAAEDSVVRAPAIGAVTAAFASTNFETPGRLTSLKVTGNLFGDVTADSVGVITAANMEGDVTVAKALTTLKTTGDYDGTATADSIGTFSAGGGDAVLNVTKGITTVVGTGSTSQVGLTLSAASVGAMKFAAEVYADDDPDTVDWNVTNGIGSLTAGGVYGIDVSAKFLGVTNIKGNLAAGLSGYVANSTFTLTGDDGSLGKFGLKSLVVQGNVTFSRFDVKTGNVGAVTVGRFHDSQLWVGYVPAASGEFTAGSVANQGRLASFRTTAVSLPEAHPLRWAFKNSEVVSGSIGTVTLSGLQTANGGTAFGIKVRGGGAVVKVLNADVPPATLPRNVALTADNNAPYTPLAGDFFFMDV